ncbi:hypothetical protein MMC17_000676, partial [Xylographa soralifera]|nr:hypothetical protein [Xylographa soralifera]
MAKIANSLVPDGTGVELCFIHGPIKEHQLSEADVLRIMQQVKLQSGTPTGRNLRDKILRPFLYDKLERGELLKRPYLITIITDGEPNDRKGDTLQEVI